MGIFSLKRLREEKISKLVLWGGCATRDALPEKKALKYELSYLHRSSMAALLSAGTDELDGILDEADSDINLRSELHAAKRDSNASWAIQQEFKDADIIIIELTGERAGVFTKTDGTREIIVSADGRYKKAVVEPIVQQGFEKCFGYSPEDGFFERLLKGMEVFLDAAKKSGAKLVLNEIYCAEKFDDGTETNPWVKGVNQRLVRYNEAFKKLAKAKNIELFVVSYNKDTEAVARKHGHKWGPFFLHFVDDYYEILPKRIWKAWRISLK